MEKNEFSFEKGWMQARQHDVSQIRQKIMRVFEITTRQGFRDRLYGRIFYKDIEKAAVEAIFAEYGITDVWGTV